jgi:hypothetical protein
MPPSLSAQKKFVNRNSLFYTLSIYCHLQYSTTNCGEQVVAEYHGLTVPYFIINAFICQEWQEIKELLLTIK